MQDTRKTRVLIVNDDGFRSTNLRALASALSAVADVVVFAPESEQSGVSQAFTVRKGLKILPVPCEENPAGKWPFEFYSVSGTPADCAKFALGHYAEHGLGLGDSSDSHEGACASVGGFDVCFSGVNVGENSGVSSLYSGTVAGAREAALWGVPGIALSLHGIKGTLLDEAIRFAKRVVTEKLYENILPKTFWNVNFPKVLESEFKGYKVAKMALGMFTDHYDVVKDGKDDLWLLDGDKLWQKEPVDSDDYLLHQGFATITPHRIDQTCLESFEKINEVSKKLAVGGSV